MQSARLAVIRKKENIFFKKNLWALKSEELN